MMKIKEKDASINDFDVTVNNTDQNATIKCSSGFYIQVAKGCFVSLLNSSVFTKDKIAITVKSITMTNEQSGLESTRLIHFSFMNEENILGGVAVHLHHSTRTIQIQGSQIMPDSARAALWFLNNFVTDRFKELAKTKKVCNKELQ